MKPIASLAGGIVLASALTAAQYGHIWLGRGLLLIGLMLIWVGWRSHESD